MNTVTEPTLASAVLDSGKLTVSTDHPAVALVYWGSGDGPDSERVRLGVMKNWPRDEKPRVSGQPKRDDVRVFTSDEDVTRFFKKRSAAVLSPVEFMTYVADPSQRVSPQALVCLLPAAVLG